MIIFNSLGSNYNADFVIKSLLPIPKSDQSVILINHLRHEFGGDIKLTFKGREAIYLALVDAKLSKGSLVAVCGFTCIAVIDAISNAGLTPIFIDCEIDDINFSPSKLENAIKKHKSLIKAVIIQNSLGYPADIEKIKNICLQNKLVLIEDLAHSYGTIYHNKRQAGTIGDYTALSFSQDKIIDGVTGGALIKKSGKIEIIQEKALKEIDLIYHIYPLITYIIRKLYMIKLGKVIHLIAKKLKLLPNPFDNRYDNIDQLSQWHCNLVSQQLHNFDQQLNHRKNISRIYLQNINKSFLSNRLCDDIEFSTNIRFPIFTPKRDLLIKYLAKYNVYVSDIWYDSQIVPKKYAEKYQNINCPNFKKISETIINLPTHINISEPQALQICQYINQWRIINSK